MKTPTQLEPVQPSDDTLALVHSLMAPAVNGQLTAEVVALHPGRSYTIEVTGALAQNPTFARGALKTLDDELARLV